MGRPVKDYWNWTKVVIAYSGDKRHWGIDSWLYSQFGTDQYYEIRDVTEWPVPRTRTSTKKTVEKHCFIKDPGIATLFALKFS